MLSLMAIEDKPSTCWTYLQRPKGQLVAVLILMLCGLLMELLKALVR